MNEDLTHDAPHFEPTSSSDPRVVTDPAELARRRALVERAAGGQSSQAPRGASKTPQSARSLGQVLRRFQGVVAPETVRSPQQASAASDCPPCPPQPPARVPSPAETPAAAERPASEPKKKPPADRAALTSNPRTLAYHRGITNAARVALQRANDRTRKGLEGSLVVPRQVHQLCHAICDDTNALAGALDWVRKSHGNGVALEVENACLYRARVRIPQPFGVQRDDWSCARARRKAALLVFVLMSPWLLKRTDVTGSTSDEDVLVTAGVPQSLLVLLLRSSQREPYSERTVQRDLAQIDECTDLLLRWKTPVCHAQPWERGGNEYGVVNRYVVRTDMIREQWRRSRDAAEAGIKGAMVRLASWMLWRPAPARGSPVVCTVGGFMVAAPS